MDRSAGDPGGIPHHLPGAVIDTVATMGQSRTFGAPGSYARVPMDTPGNVPDDLLAESFAILAFCGACDHRAPQDRTRIPLGVTVQAPRGRLRCSIYGHRGALIPIAYTGAGGFRYGCQHAIPEPRSN